MKLNKILLTIPALSCVVLPLSGCACNNPQSNPVKVTINDEDKTIKTLQGVKTSVFELHLSREIDISQILVTGFTTKDGSVQPEGYYIYLSPTDKTILYLFVSFKDTVVGGEYCKFDIEFTVGDEKTVSTLTDLKVTYMAEHNILPNAAFIISEDTITGINEDFDTTDYDTLKIPSNITTIAESAFDRKFTSTTRSTITSLIIDHEVTIKRYAFNECDAFESIDITDAVKSSATVTVESNAFFGWKTSGEIVYPTLSYSYNPIDYALCDGGLGTNWFDTTVTRNVLASDLTIDSNYNIKANWTYNNMPNHIKKLCNILDMSAYSEVKHIAANGFYSVDDSESLIPENITTLGLPKTITSLEQNCLRKCACTQFLNPTTEEAGNRLVLPSTVTTIGTDALAQMSNLNYLELNDGLTTIGSLAFEENALYGISIPSSVTTISAGAFRESPNLVSIDVRSVTASEVPSGWSTDLNTFSGLPDEGWVLCKPENATKWTNYFSTFVTFQKGAWQITDDVDILKTYTPQVAARTGVIFASIDDMMDDYGQAMYDNWLVCFDDMIWTVQNYINKSDYDVFNLKVNNLSFDTLYGTFTFMLTYKVKFKNESTTYTGYLYFANMDLNTLNTYKRHEDEYYQLTFGSILEQQASIVEVYEEDSDGTVIVDQIYKKKNFPSSLSVEAFGNVINKLKLFTFDASGSPMFEIRSHYLMNCKVNGE